jgi:hypothetical protein
MRQISEEHMQFAPQTPEVQVQRIQALAKEIEVYWSEIIGLELFRLKDI